MSLFITGTDTDVGKTMAALLLLQALKKQGYTVAAMKPIACGCEQTSGGLRNEDALLLMAEASVQIPYDIVNPYAFAPPIAPHIAAQQSAVQINLARIKACYQQIKSQVDIVIVEGAGGWLVPINDTQTMADMVKHCNWDVALVVGMRLGCLNHSLLTVANIQQSQCQLKGWVANCLDTQMQNQSDNIESLRSRIEPPMLAQIPHLAQATHGERYYQLEKLVDTT